jgi:hypothetical protein
MLGVRVGRSSDYLSVTQFDLLSWVSGGCQQGIYEGNSYRVSARALHNRGLILVEGRGPAWAAKITAEGTRLLKQQARQVEAERLRARRAEEAHAEQERELQRLRARALEVLEAVTAAGGRFALQPDYSEREVTQIADCLARERLLPDGQRLAHEPTRMDPVLGVSAYLEPDFAALTPLRTFKIPQQLRGPHPAVTASQERRERVSRAQIPRVARYLQGLVNAVVEMGWSVPAKVEASYANRGESGPDLSIKLPSGEFLVSVRELDEHGRHGRAFITQTDYVTRTERTTVNKSFTASGKLEVTLTRGWEQHPVLTQRDSGRSTLEEQLPALIRVLEIGKAEAEWTRKEEERRADIRKDRWEEVKAEAFVHVAYERNAERLLAELDSRDTAAAMRAYANEIDARAAALEAQAARAAREWAGWIREHAERTDPLSGPLHLEEVTSCSYEELQPHMRGWSAYGPHLR